MTRQPAMGRARARILQTDLDRSQKLFQIASNATGSSDGPLSHVLCGYSVSGSDSHELAL